MRVCSSYSLTRWRQNGGERAIISEALARINRILDSADWRLHVLPAEILLYNGYGRATQTKSLKPSNLRLSYPVVEKNCM